MFEDGMLPNQQIIQTWLDAVDKFFDENSSNADTNPGL